MMPNLPRPGVIIVIAADTTVVRNREHSTSRQVKFSLSCSSSARGRSKTILAGLIGSATSLLNGSSGHLPTNDHFVREPATKCRRTTAQHFG
jgi:hypothetical protein